MLATLLWLAASTLLSWYVSHIASFGATYGPLGAVVGIMLWFYVSAYAVLLGAELNARLEANVPNPPPPQGPPLKRLPPGNHQPKSHRTGKHRTGNHRPRHHRRNDHRRKDHRRDDHRPKDRRIAPKRPRHDSACPHHFVRRGIMAGWDDGYVTDVAYTTNFYREITPAWLATTCLLLGQRPPDLTRPFRYADLGCGHGFTALVVAATCPQAEVWAFDFNPAHIEWANRLAAAAGLTNVRFVEASFAELAALPEAALPAFDFMVSHGVLSWISPENRRLMLDVIRQRLRPAAWPISATTSPPAGPAWCRCAG